MAVTVVALPGFTRSPRHLERLAQAVNAAGLPCVRPSLAPRWLPVLYMSRPRLQRLAQRLVDAGVGSVVIAGHSAGAAAAGYLAVCLQRLGIEVRGLVLIDGVDSPNHLLSTSLPLLGDVPVAAVLAPPSPCNRHGSLARMLRDYPQVDVAVIDGAGHGDIEGAGLNVYRRACGDHSDVETADRVLGTVVDRILEFARHDPGRQDPGR